jgi:hypothetical protein
MSKGVLRNIGIGLLLIPLSFLLLFTFGEVFSGDISGLSHLFQAAPLVLLIVLAYKKPYIAGVILLLAGLGLGILYPLKAPFNLQTIVIVEMVLFIPPCVAGLLLMLSSKKT